MPYRFYLLIRKPIRAQYHLYFQNHFSDYTIILPDTKDLPASFSEEPDSVSTSKQAGSFILCDSDEGLREASRTGLPLIAIRHDQNRDQDLMHAPWLIDSPQSLTTEFLNEVRCRHLKLPLTILTTDHYLVRELTSGDLDLLLTLQRENADNPSGCFFPEDLIQDTRHNTDPLSKQASAFLDHYIAHQYPFFGYGFYGIEYNQSHTTIGIAGFYDNPETDLHDETTSKEVGYALLEAYRNKGVMSELLPALIDYGREQLGFEHLTARIAKDNTSSLRLAEKCGLEIILLK